MATRSALSAAARAVNARDLTLAALNEAAALLKVLQAQVSDDAAEAMQPGCHYGHAGDAQNLAHDLRKLALRNFLQPNGSEAHAELRLNALLERVRTEGAL